MLGYLSFFVNLLPEAAVAPILIFIGVEITAQAFEATPHKHYRAIAISFVPAIACLVSIQFGQMLGGLGKSSADLSGELLATYNATTLLGNGFIVTSLLWGATFSDVLDHRPGRAALYLLVCALFSLCGVIHSPLPSGALFSPLSPPAPISRHLAAGYAVMALAFALLERGRKSPPFAIR
jgi:AGZA family xanthine/uracil permease-like MFS transporter